MRWKGLVDDRLSFDGAGGADACGTGGGEKTGCPFCSDLLCDNFLKYGLRDSWAGGLETGVGSYSLLEDGGAARLGGGDATEPVSIWLVAGVLPCGVKCCGPSSSSSSDDESFSICSSCSWSCRSRSRAASNSALWEASLASFSLAPLSAAFLRAFSSCFLTLPALTCSSSARSRAWAASRSFSMSFSCAFAAALGKMSVGQFVHLEDTPTRAVHVVVSALLVRL